MANDTIKKIYLGTELKFQVDIESDGFSMADDDFNVVIKNKKIEKTIKKEDMLVTAEEKYIFTLDTAEFGAGEYIIITTAYVPDEDFDDGLRTEVTKQTLCVVTN